MYSEMPDGRKRNLWPKQRTMRLLNRFGNLGHFFKTIIKLKLKEQAIQNLVIMSFFL